MNLTTNYDSSKEMMMKALTKLFTLFGQALSATAFKRPFNSPSSKRQSPRDGTRHDVGRQRKGLVGAQRLAPAKKGGNWQGLPYLTLAEHDQCVRASFGSTSRYQRDLSYRAEMEKILATH
jgi:hypothetical protein